MKSFLQGKRLGHPLHPLLVHFPIGLFLLSLLLDISTVLFDASTAQVQAAFWSLAAGVGLALIAAIPGLVDFLDIRRDHPARKLAIQHMIFNLSAVAIYGVGLGFRATSLSSNQTPWIPFALSIAAFSLISYSGHLGGKMVYEDGLAVGRHRRVTPKPEKTLTASRLDDEWFTVCPEERLQEGASLRVNVENRVLVIAKFAGQLYAFQEFCTHRFGPLSEGTFHDGQVECPWHRSCFDLSSGKVTKGPAKMDLKTYPFR